MSCWLCSRKITCLAQKQILTTPGRMNPACESVQIEIYLLSEAAILADQEDMGSCVVQVSRCPLARQSHGRLAI